MPKSNWFGIPGELPPNVELLQLIVGKWVNQASAIYAAELGIADRLKDGPRPSTEVARECGANAVAIYRLMRALAMDPKSRPSFRSTEEGATRDED